MESPSTNCQTSLTGLNAEHGSTCPRLHMDIPQSEHGLLKNPTNPLNDYIRFVQTVLVSAITCLSVFLIFTLLRSYNPRWFETRRGTGTENLMSEFIVDREEEEESAVETPDFHGVCSWLTEPWMWSNDDMLRYTGFDATVFLAFLQACLLILLFCTPFGLLILIPIYLTERNSKEVFNQYNFITNTAATRLEPGSTRLWAVPVSAWIFTLIIYFVLYRTYKTICYQVSQWHVQDRPSRYTILVQDIPIRLRSKSAIREYFERLCPGEVQSVIVVHDNTTLRSQLKQLTHFENRQSMAQDFLGENGYRQRVQQYVCFGKEYDVLDDSQENIRRLRQQILRTKNRLCAGPSAFVRFRSITAATTCASISIEPGLDGFLAVMAPEPPQIRWLNLSFTTRQLLLNDLLVTGIMFIIILAWLGPVIAITALGHLRELNKTFDLNLDRYFSDSTQAWMESVISIIILQLWLILLPSLLNYVTRFQKKASMVDEEVSSMTKYYDCLILMILLVTVFGTGLQNISEFVANIQKILNTLGLSLARMSTTFMNYILVCGLIFLPLELLRYCYYLLRCFCCCCMSTQKPLFPFGYWYAQHMLILVICATYSVIQPLIMLAGVLYFSIAYTVSAYQLAKTYHPTAERGAAVWPYVFGRLCKGLFIGLATVMGLLILRSGYSQAACIIPLFVINYKYEVQVQKHFRTAFATAPLSEARRVDEERRVVVDRTSQVWQSVDIQYRPTYFGVDLPQVFEGDIDGDVDSVEL